MAWLSRLGSMMSSGAEIVAELKVRAISTTNLQLEPYFRAVSPTRAEANSTIPRRELAIGRRRETFPDSGSSHFSTKHRQQPLRLPKELLTSRVETASHVPVGICGLKRVGQSTVSKRSWSAGIRITARLAVLSRLAALMAQEA